MLAAIWDFLKDDKDRAVLAWIGTGIVTVAGGVWAVVTFLAKKREAVTPVPSSIKADHGSVAFGGDNRDSPITIGTRETRKH